MRLLNVAAPLVAASLAVAGAGAAPAFAAAPYPPAAVVCTISPDPVYPNATVTITCTGYAVGSTVTFTVVTNGHITSSTATAHGAVAHASGGESAHATVPASGTVSVTEQAGATIGTSTFQASGHDTSGATQVRQITTHVISNPSSSTSNGAGNTNGRGGTRTSVLAATLSCTSNGTLSRSTASVGQTVTFAGGGFAANTPVVLTDSAGNDLGSTVSDGAGQIHAPISEGQPGTYTVYASGKGGGACAGRERTLVAGLTVTRAEGADLPFTGIDGLWLLLLLAIVLIAGGSGVVAAARRRRLVRANH